MKADVAFALSGVPTIGAPGATNWKPALKAAKAVGARTIRLAYDADFLVNDDVVKALESLARRP